MTQTQFTTPRSIPLNGEGLVADATHMSYIGRQPGTCARDSDSWYTPAGYIESARKVMGSIDLDPFSSAYANKIVRASSYFSPSRSAFDQEWYPLRWKVKYPEGLNIWMNPPYGAGLIGPATARFLSYWSGGGIAQAVVLVNNATETLWFKSLREKSCAVCFPSHRIAFQAPDGRQISGNTRGQVFFYFGSLDRAAAFVEVFSQYGWTISKEHGWNG